MECDTFVDVAVKRMDDFKEPIIVRHQKHGPNIPCMNVVEHEKLFGRHAENGKQVCAWVGIISPISCQCIVAANNGELKRAVVKAVTK